MGNHVTPSIFYETHQRRLHGAREQEVGFCVPVNIRAPRQLLELDGISLWMLNAWSASRTIRNIFLNLEKSEANAETIAERAEYLDLIMLAMPAIHPVLTLFQVATFRDESLHEEKYSEALAVHLAFCSCDNIPCGLPATIHRFATDRVLALWDSLARAMPPLSADDPRMSAKLNTELTKAKVAWKADPDIMNPVGPYNTLIVGSGELLVPCPQWKPVDLEPVTPEVEYQELLDSIDRKNLHVKWRKLTPMQCGETLLEIIAELCNARLAGIEGLTERLLQDANVRLNGVRIRDAIKSAKNDPRLVNLVNRPVIGGKSGFSLNLPSTVLLPLP